MLVVVWALASWSNVNPAWSEDPGIDTIAFQSDRTADGAIEIFAVAADGSNLRQLTDGPGSALGPDWSPDGRRIAFSASRAGASDVYVMNADGTRVRRLTRSPAVDREPSWSPDGKRLTFVSERDGNREVYVMKQDGSKVVRITDDLAEDDHPDWGPDGRIVFETRRDGQWEIYAMESDGTGLVKLTNDAAQDQYPAWSPDGEWIAFASNRDRAETSASRRFWVMRADGSEVRPVVPQVTARCSEVGGVPAWSPDGTRMAFGTLCGAPGTQELHRANLDGTDDVVLTTGHTDGRPSWSPR
jgi:Tol biopolymer transport system component